MSEQTDPRTLLDHSPMTAMQIVAVAVCVLLNALDGFDVLSISFASPGIAAEWGIDRAALGLVLSMELIGMAIGSIVIGQAADRFGRRPTILVCLLVMATGMLAASAASDVQTLSAVRLVTGLGIGGMLAVTNAMAAEFSNLRNRALAVALMAAGYPVGAIVGGAVASHLLIAGDWRDVFILGGLATAAFLPVVWFLLPESVSHLAERRPARALERINRTLAHLRRPILDSLPEAVVAQDAEPRESLLTPRLLRLTVLLTLAYSAHIMTFYFILKWIPKIVVDMGYAPSTAGGVLVWANVGGLLGAVCFSLLTRVVPVKQLMAGVLVLACGMIVWFGQGQDTIAGLSLVAAATGFFTNAGVVGFYALIAQAYPTSVRAGGTGVVIGIGRGGAALGPIVAGLLFAAGGGLSGVALAMAAGSLGAAIILLFLRSTERAPVRA